MKMYGRATEVAERIVEAFKHPETLPAALAPIFIHRNDDAPCRKWSWHNQLLVILSGTSDARGMKQWHAVKRKVKKGSSAVWILAPCMKTLKEKDDDTGEEQKRNLLYGFKAVPVYRLEDTEGEPLPGDEEQESWISSLPLVDVAKAWGINVGTYGYSGNAPLGYFQSSTRGKAIMLGVENLSTFTHELCHAADEKLHSLRDKIPKLEIVAELGGAILLECIGEHTESDLGGAYQYVERYAEQMNKPTVKACIDLLDRVCNVVSLILDEAERLGIQEQSGSRATGCMSSSDIDGGTTQSK